MDNKQQKLVSIILPAYNIEKYITQTIESIIGQTYKNLELLVVNDGSIDGTEKIIEEYSKKDNRIKYLNQENSGIPSARNNGLKIAKGEYLCIFDGDDIMLPDKIESQFNFLEENKEIDFTYSKVYYFVDNTENVYIRNFSVLNGSEYVYKKLLKCGNLITPNAVFFRRSIFDRLGGFDENLRSSEDFDYWLKLSGNRVNFLHQDKYLTLCRIRKGSATWNSFVIYSTLVSVFKKYIPNIEKSFWQKIKYPQYLRSKFLLYISTLKNPKNNINNISNNKKKIFSISFFIGNLFAFLRKIKFLLIFKKVEDKKIRDYLIKIESYKRL